MPKNKKSKSKNSECVKVIVRVRPLNQQEIDNKSTNILQVFREENSISINKRGSNNRNAMKNFTYDAVYPHQISQQTIYEESAFHLVESVAEGFNGTIFAYGQTGCGKTYTMMGPDPLDSTKRGIIPRSFTHIFKIIQNESDKDKKFLVRCSYIEIYNDQIRDLLGKD